MQIPVSPLVVLDGNNSKTLVDWTAIIDKTIEAADRDRSKAFTGMNHSRRRFLYFIKVERLLRLNYYEIAYFFRSRCTCSELRMPLGECRILKLTLEAIEKLQLTRKTARESINFPHRAFKSFARAWDSPPDFSLGKKRQINFARHNEL